MHFRAQPDFWGIVTIPIVAAVVTWAHVWLAMKMVFYPIDFVGFNKPWLGWQGIVPRRAGKMGGILVDNSLSKLGSIDEFFWGLEPDKIARHIGGEISEQVVEIVDGIMHEKNHVLWENLPSSLKCKVYAQVQARFPDIVDGLMRDIGENVSDLIDLRSMVVTHMESDRALVVRIFQEVGSEEIAFVVSASFWLGLFFGLVQMVLWCQIPWRWGLPIYGATLGCLTNWVALNMVFRPLNPTRIGPWVLQGVFLKRQAEVSAKFAELTTREVLSIKHLMTELLTGKRSYRVKAFIKRHVSPLLEGTLVRTAAQLTVGPAGYVALKRTVLDKAITLTLKPVQDLSFNRSRAGGLERMLSDRMQAMSSKDFQDLLRPAFEEDEWIIIVMGAVMGLIAGGIQLALGFN
jgi:uncharacterized membrane protein YheB (UPF0754 family)